MTVLLNDESPQLVGPVPEDAPPHQASSSVQSRLESHPPKRELRWNNIYFNSILPFLYLVMPLRLLMWIVLVSFIENSSHRQSLFDAGTDSARNVRATVLFFRPNLHLSLLQFPTKYHIFSKRMPLHIF